LITTLSIETKLKQWLLHRRMSTDAFASLAKLEGISGCSETRLRQAFGGRCFDGPLSLRLWNLRNEIETICKKVEPLVLDLSDAAVIHELLKAWRGEELLVIVSGPKDGNSNNQPVEEQINVSRPS
jgi:hypothetical protein